MSILGTTVASSVAATPQQAQQVSTPRDRSANQTAADTQRVRETFEAHLRELEEGEESESPDRLHIDSQLPQHQSPPQDQPQQEHRPPPEDDQKLQAHEATDLPTSSRPAQDDEDSLYHHLDVKA
jgi:hypothetical protein